MDPLHGAEEAWPTGAVTLCETAFQSGSVILHVGMRDSRSAVVLLRAALRAYSEGQAPSPQLYALDEDAATLRSAIDMLRNDGLEAHAVFYQGNLARFRRDVPMTPNIVHLDGTRNYSAIWSELNLLHHFAAPATPILCSDLSAEARQAFAAWCKNEAFNVVTESDHALLLRTGRGCCGQVRGLEPKVFAQVQNALLVHYGASEEARPAQLPGWERALTAAARHRGHRHAAHRGTSGRGPWPFAPVEAPLPPTLPDGKPWPKISIVTPSYNQGRYLEETILSVLHQGYPNVEHLIIDAGSTDDTLEVLKRYGPRLAYVVSEKDRGQSHALNKGFARATGDILTWLNSDDMLAPGALAAVALAFHESGADMVAGMCQLQSQGKIIDQHLTSGPNAPAALADMLDLDHGWNAGEFFYQPEVMFTRQLWEKAGGRVDEAYYYGMDYEMWLRFAACGARMQVIGRPVAIFRVHPDQKTAAMERAQKELVLARDAFLQKHNQPLQVAPPPVPPRQGLRMVLLDDRGFRGTDGHVRPHLVRALAAGGHHVAVASLSEGTLNSEAVFAYLVHQQPDLVIFGSFDETRLGQNLAQKIARHWKTVSTCGLCWTQPAVAVDVFRPRDRDACREALGLPTDRFLILTPPQREGLQHLAAALERLELPDAQVLVAGACPAEELPSGWQCLENLADDRQWALAFAAADVYVDASPVGPAFQPFAEAAACGTPAVAYRIGVAHALPDGVAGQLAAVVDPAALADVIEELYGDPAQRAVLARWERVHAVSHWSAAAAYHHFHCEMTARGLRDAIGLARKISIVQPADNLGAPACMADAWSEWQPVAGFGPWQPADVSKHLPAGRWAPAARSTFAVTSAHSGRHRLLIRYVNPHPEQRIRLLYQGQLVLECALPVSAPFRPEQTLSCAVELPAGAHAFELVCWQPAEASGALLISGILYATTATLATGSTAAPSIPVSAVKQAA